MFSFWSIDLCSIEAYQQLAQTKRNMGVWHAQFKGVTLCWENGFDYERLPAK